MQVGCDRLSCCTRNLQPAIGWLKVATHPGCHTSCHDLPFVHPPFACWKLHTAQGLWLAPDVNSMPGQRTPNKELPNWCLQNFWDPDLIILCHIQPGPVSLRLLSPTGPRHPDCVRACVRASSQWPYHDSSSCSPADLQPVCVQLQPDCGDPKGHFTPSSV